MKIINIGSVPKQEVSWSLFTDKVFKQAVLGDVDRSDITVDYIYFPEGVKNKFHSHDTGQVLIVTHGRGIVATEKKEFNVKEGDIIHIPAGEKHWHGAGTSSDFTHIAIAKAGSKLKQFEK